MKTLIFCALLAVSGAVHAEPRQYISDHQGVFGGQQIRYRAIVQEHLVPGADGKPAASVFTMTYLRTGLKPAQGAERPVIFAFNGGPGSAAIWLHMGFLGPQRVDAGEPGKPNTLPPFRYVPNDDSPLDVADIVLIDPPGTGYSRMLEGAAPQFYAVDSDAQMTVGLIREWALRHGRLNSPKFLVSESYGTVRAAVVAKLLAGGPMTTGRMDGIGLNGVVLLGQAMDFSGEGGDLRYLTALPTMAATACLHGKGPASCTSAGQADTARAFARDTLLPALYAGNRLDPATRSKVAGELAALIGLERQEVLDRNLRVSLGEYSKLLLRTEGRRIGLYDARYTLALAGAGSDPVADDPAMGQYVPAYVGAWSDYARRELGIDLAEPYEAISFRTVNGQWDYGFGPGVPFGRNFAADLATAMNHNPNLRVMIGTGYYDLVTTIGAAEYTAAHVAMPPDRVVFHEYESGHMPYLGDASRRQLAADIRHFVTGR